MMNLVISCNRLEREKEFDDVFFLLSDKVCHLCPPLGPINLSSSNLKRLNLAPFCHFYRFFFNKKPSVFRNIGPGDFFLSFFFHVSWILGVFLPFIWLCKNIRGDLH